MEQGPGERLARVEQDLGHGARRMDRIERESKERDAALEEARRRDREELARLVREGDEVVLEAVERVHAECVGMRQDASDAADRRSRVSVTLAIAIIGACATVVSALIAAAALILTSQ